MAIYSKATGACAQEGVFKIDKRGHSCCLVDGKFSQNSANDDDSNDSNEETRLKQIQSLKVKRKDH